MSKSKKNTKNDKQNSAKDCENNMSYSQDNKTDSASDCQSDKAHSNSESNCR